MKSPAEWIEALKRAGARRPQGRPDPQLPPGQHRVDNFPVLDLGMHPVLTEASWRLRLFGAVAQPFEWSWSEWSAASHAELTADFHCVTRWSRFGLRWAGVPLAVLLEQAQVRADGRFLLLHGADGYTTNVTLDEALGSRAMVADAVDGKSLSAVHGGPARFVMPTLYGWKSAKWLQGIEVLTEERLGFWETRGYHRHGDPWQEERFAGTN